MNKILSRKQYDEWMATQDPEVCPFCDYNGRQIVLKEGRHWVWIANIAPYWQYHTLLIPKRHFVEVTEMTIPEMGEMFEMYDYVLGQFREKHIGKKYVIFWRKRDDRFDSVSKTQRYDHFHVHIVPDKDHLWDPLLDPKAYELDLKEVFETDKPTV